MFIRLEVFRLPVRGRKFILIVSTTAASDSMLSVQVFRIMRRVKFLQFC